MLKKEKNMNQVSLTGNLVRDIETKVVGEKKVVSNCVAVNRERKNANGEYESDFINIVVWEKQAEYLESKAHKGDRVELTGRLQVRSYKNKDGADVKATEVVVEKISVFQKNPQASAQARPTNAVKQTAKVEPSFESDDDLPF